MKKRGRSFSFFLKDAIVSLTEKKKRGGKEREKMRGKK